METAARHQPSLSPTPDRSSGLAPLHAGATNIIRLIHTAWESLTWISSRSVPRRTIGYSPDCDVC